MYRTLDKKLAPLFTEIFLLTPLVELITPTELSAPHEETAIGRQKIYSVGQLGFKVNYELLWKFSHMDVKGKRET